MLQGGDDQDDLTLTLISTATVSSRFLWISMAQMKRRVRTQNDIDGSDEAWGVNSKDIDGSDEVSGGIFIYLFVSL